MSTPGPARPLSYWQAKQRLGKANLERPSLVFRGEESTSWRLQPTLLRQPTFVAMSDEDKGTTVDRMLATFRAIAKARRPLEDPVPDDDDFVLAMGQHHGLPTPLLDWTGSYLIALFFAFGGWRGKKIEKGSEVCVWALDTKALYERALRFQRSRDGADEKDSDEDVRHRFDKSPYAIKLIDRRVWANARQIAQDGYFTKQGPLVDSLDGFLLEQERRFFGSRVLWRWIVRCDDQSEALEDLRNSMVTIDRLRNDLDGAFLETRNRVLKPWSY
jgi:hypothetical protein